MPVVNRVAIQSHLNVRNMADRRHTWPLLMPEVSRPWNPNVDVYRVKGGWILKCDLAGVQVEDVTVRIRGRFVSVTGYRRDSAFEEASSCYKMEILYNRFERTVELPSLIENARVSLEARDGILLVRMVMEEGE